MKQCRLVFILYTAVFFWLGFAYRTVTGGRNIVIKDHSDFPFKTPILFSVGYKSMKINPVKATA